MKATKSITAVVLSLVAMMLMMHPPSVGAAVGRSHQATEGTVGRQGLQQPPSDALSHRSVQGTDEYEPWPNGTPVAAEFPNEGWWSGMVTHYNADSGMYAITWEDGSVDYYDDVDEMDKMVASANEGLGSGSAGSASSGAGTVYTVGTPVSIYEKGRWWDGVIIKYADGVYTVQWVSDNEMERIQQGSVIDKMVADAKDADAAAAAADEADAAAGVAASGEALWETGTPVASYEEGRWWRGHITGFAKGVYTVTWNDGEVDTFTDFDVVNKMVSDAETLAASGSHHSSAPATTEAPATGGGTDKVTDAPTDEVTVAPTEGEETAAPTATKQPYPKGTIVYKEFPGEGWFVGTLVHYKAGTYTVEWDDGSHDKFVAGAEMDEMVANAAYVPNDDSLVASGGELAAKQQQTQNGGDSGVSGAGKAFLSILVLVVAALGVFLGVKVYQRRRWAAQEAAQKALDEPCDDVVAYRDEPEDDLPKII